MSQTGWESNHTVSQTRWESSHAVLEGMRVRLGEKLVILEAVNQNGLEITHTRGDVSQTGSH